MKRTDTVNCRNCYYLGHWKGKEWCKLTEKYFKNAKAYVCDFFEKKQADDEVEE